MDRGFFTRRGRRVVQVVGVAACWLIGFVLVGLSVALDVDAPRPFGLFMAAVAAMWTVCLVQSRRDELLIAAFEAGRAHERESVTPMRR